MISPSEPAEWFVFRIPLGRILTFLERRTGQSFPVRPDGECEARRWHLALREGLGNRLHLNVGIPGVEIPANPVEENAAVLHAALLLRIPVLEVIVSGEWEVAVAEGLLTREQAEHHEAVMLRDWPPEPDEVG